MPTMTLKRGDSGPAVERWQETLNVLGSSIVVDGAFGPATETATRALQKQLGVAADGIVGPYTVTALKEKYAGIDFDLQVLDPESGNAFWIVTGGVLLGYALIKIMRKG